MMSYSTIQIEAFENYQKRSFRNRFYINSPQGKTLVSIPLIKGKNAQTRIIAVEIAYHTNWVEVLHKKIKSCYGNAPFFDYYFPHVSEVFNKKPKYLYQLNWHLLKLVFKLLQVDIAVRETKLYEISAHESTTDLRNYFLINNIRSAPIYEQVFESTIGFVSDLSILDLLFCCGPESGSILLRDTNNL